MGLRTAGPEDEMLGVGRGWLAVLVSRSVQAAITKVPETVACNS